LQDARDNPGQYISIVIVILFGLIAAAGAVATALNVVHHWSDGAGSPAPMPRDDHRDVLSDAQHQKNDRPQRCVSRVVSPRTAGKRWRQAAEYGTVTIDVP